MQTAPANVKEEPQNLRTIPVRAAKGSKRRVANAGSSTYRYRDPVKRRAYMAQYMRDYRAEKAQEHRVASASAA